MSSPSTTPPVRQSEERQQNTQKKRSGGASPALPQSQGQQQLSCSGSMNLATETARRESNKDDNIEKPSIDMLPPSTSFPLLQSKLQKSPPPPGSTRNLISHSLLKQPPDGWSRVDKSEQNNSRIVKKREYFIRRFEICFEVTAEDVEMMKNSAAKEREKTEKCLIDSSTRVSRATTDERENRKPADDHVKETEDREGEREEGEVFEGDREEEEGQPQKSERRRLDEGATREGETRAAAGGEPLAAEKGGEGGQRFQEEGSSRREGEGSLGFYMGCIRLDDEETYIHARPVIKFPAFTCMCVNPRSFPPMVRRSRPLLPHAI